MNGAPFPVAADAPAVPPQAGILFQTLCALPAGTWVELGDGGAPAGPAIEFAGAGWRALRLGAGADAADPADPLAACGALPVHWMAVHDGALARLAAWQAGACRPLVVLTRPALPAPAGLPPPAWQTALSRNGYLFVAEDDDHAYFVRDDQTALHATLAQLASKGWRARLQASRHAHAHEARAARQARKAVQQARAQVSAAQAEVQALQHQLAAVYASSSWRSTRPLRWGGRLARQPRSALRELAVLGVRLLRKVVRPALSRALADPRLRRRLALLERRHPALVRRLKSLLHPPVAAPSMATLALAAPPAIHPNNIVGPQFKTLLLDELDRGLPPTSR